MTGLYGSTSYSFRVCGKDDAGGASACAQTRSFRTAPAAQDSVVGNWLPSPSFYGSVDVHAAASGPLGSISARNGFDHFTGTAICLHLEGNKAAVSAVGNVPGEPTAKETMLARFVDAGPAASDAVGVAIQAGTTPPDCASVSFEGLRNIEGAGDVVINNP